MGKLTFTKAERLCKENWIKELFEKGSSFNLYPFRILHLSHPDATQPDHQVLISVSIRNFARAVDRNLLKRRIRESYRLEKTLLPQDSRKLIAYIYTSRTIEDFDTIRNGMVSAMGAITSNRGQRKTKKDAQK